MRLSFSTRGWSHLSWEEYLDIGVNMDFEGVEVYNLPKFPELTERSAGRLTVNEIGVGYEPRPIK